MKMGPKEAVILTSEDLGFVNEESPLTPYCSDMSLSNVKISEFFSD